ncbi:hypothetical protein [Qipengyuania vesicularis]|uniref:hypothetical protein n=1 Tax=Qipengyuania vesicularis TaxID=2867232 RepID=UPI001C888B77|nr:hypothetical protein [Qipengyuania vesicularis]MBX7527030.1 hypothetical protein [Qipengyuania vesicularis]
MIKKTLLLALPFALAACGSGADTDTIEAGESPAATSAKSSMVEDHADALLVVDANGVGARGADVFRFGSPRTQVDAGLAKAFGSAAETGENFDCGAGPMQFSNYGPLQVAYQDGNLAGWFLREGEAAATSDGVQPGSTSFHLLKQERQVRELDSTLPGEFEYTSADYGTIGGFVEDGVVKSLHAGMTCFFR